MYSNKKTLGEETTVIVGDRYKFTKTSGALSAGRSIDHLKLTDGSTSSATDRKTDIKKMSAASKSNGKNVKPRKPEI